MLLLNLTLVCKIFCVFFKRPESKLKIENVR